MLTFAHVPGEANSAHLGHRMAPECHKTGVGVPGECPEHHLYGKMDIIWTCKQHKMNIQTTWDEHANTANGTNSSIVITNVLSWLLYNRVGFTKHLSGLERTRADYQSNHSSHTKIHNLHFHSHSRSCGQVPLLTAVKLLVSNAHSNTSWWLTRLTAQHLGRMYCRDRIKLNVPSWPDKLKVVVSTR